MKKAAKKEINTTLPLFNLSGKVVGEVKLDEKLFDGKINKTLLYEVNKMYEANKRQGTASTKTRAHVAGGGIKPWRQKGTGRARAGSIRSPLWRHGGIVFGPHPRDYSYSLPKKAMRVALLSSLNARFIENLIKPVVKIEFKEAKTKVFQKFMDDLKTEGKTLVVVDKTEKSTLLSARNIKNVTLIESRNLNARDVLLNEHLVIEKDALEKLAERLK